MKPISFKGHCLYTCGRPRAGDVARGVGEGARARHELPLRLQALGGELQVDLGHPPQFAQLRARHPSGIAVLLTKHKKQVCGNHRHIHPGKRNFPCNLATLEPRNEHTEIYAQNIYRTEATLRLVDAIAKCRKICPQTKKMGFALDYSSGLVQYANPPSWLVDPDNTALPGRHSDVRAGEGGGSPPEGGVG